MFVQASSLEVAGFICAVLRCGGSLVVELTNGMCMTHERGSELFGFIRLRNIHLAGSYGVSIFPQSTKASREANYEQCHAASETAEMYGIVLVACHH